MVMSWRRMALVLLALPMVLAVSACGSQIAGLKPVSGDVTYKLRVAAIDVLTSQNVVMKVVPSCQQGETQVTCSGSTLAGEPITVTSPGARADTMSITVGDQEIFSGSIMTVLNEHASAP